MEKTLQIIFMDLESHETELEYCLQPPASLTISSNLHRNLRVRELAITDRQENVRSTLNRILEEWSG